MVDYVELLIGEVLLGDVSNKYLYVGEDHEAQAAAMRRFARLLVGEGQQVSTIVSTVVSTPGKIVVNGTQQFLFVDKDQGECVVRGMSFNRIFIDVECVSTRDRIKQFMAPQLVCRDGDFV